VNILPAHGPRKRPILVWIICLFFFICSSFGLFLLVFFLLRGSGDIPSGQNQGQPHEALTVLDYLLSGLTVLLGISGSVYLFILRRPALYLFGGLFLFNLLNCINQDVFENEPAATGSTGFVTILVAVSIDLAVFLYVWRLWATKVLR
jgi:hypothetical protein